MRHWPASALIPSLAGFPTLWRGLASWRVLETHGHRADHFLTTWAAWQADAKRCRMLHYAVIVADPATYLEIHDLPSDPLADLRAELSQQAWGLVPGIHRLSFDSGRVLLTVCVGDAALLLRQQTGAFDAILFNPSPQTPESLRSGPTLRAIARCSASNALLIGSRDAVPLSKSLHEAGFTDSEPYSHEGVLTSAWHCRYDPAWAPRSLGVQRPQEVKTPGHCIVLGAGLSGAAVAASLARRGWQVTVMDAAAAPAAGASGLPVGLFAPNVSADDNLIARISRAGVRATARQCEQILKSGVDWLATGVLERRRVGKPGLAPSSSAQSQASKKSAADWTRLATPADAVAADWAADVLALHHQRAGWVKPAQLVRALLAQPGIVFQAHSAAHQLQRLPANTPNPADPPHSPHSPLTAQAWSPAVWRVLGENGDILGEADLVVVASGHHSGSLLQTAGLAALPLNAIRGQMSWGMQTDAMVFPPLPVNGQGALIAQVPIDGGMAWHAGSTFERERTQLPVPADEQLAAHAHNFQQLQALLPQVAKTLAPIFERGNTELRHWSGVRCTVPDRLPLVGPVATETHPGLCLCTGMGARGLSRAVLCAEILAAQLHDEPLPLEARLAAAMAADRFDTQRAQM